MPSMVPGEELAAAARHAVLARVRHAAEAEGPPLEEVVNETVVHETRRLAHAAKDPRGLADRAFVKQTAAALGKGGESVAPGLLEAIADRYAEEIAGHFDERVYRATTSVLPLALTALLNGTSPGRALLRVHELPRLSDRLRISGEIDLVRRLAARGTLVLAPTHVSNLDSVILGYALHKLGLPPFAYGAGLNLFESRMLGFFMHHLGAYTVDRQKTDPLYKAMLKEYATVSLERGQHGLFFPGGTRSRSGGLERSLKKGLLGTSLTALARNVTAGRARPGVFVVPCTLTYPLVLEASSLIEAFLERSGEAMWIAPVGDESDRLERWLRFLEGVLALDLEVHLRIGAPLDPFGCRVDEEGRSLDPRGRAIDSIGYLRDGAHLVEDPARDAEYTRQLEASVLTSYRRNGVVIASSLVAFVVFEHLRRAAEASSLHRFLRQLGPWTRVSRAAVVADVARALEEVRVLERAGAIAVDEDLGTNAAAVVHRALGTFATYHDPHVLVAQGEDLLVGDPNLLFYYRNRLDETGLCGAPSTLDGWDV